MSLHVEVITPEKKVLSEDVDFIASPAVDGEVGILPGHAPLLARLGMGVMRFKKGDKTEYLALTGGFLEVRSHSHVSIFAETAEMSGEIDFERAKIAAERAKFEMRKIKGSEGLELEKIEADLKRAMLRVKVAEVRRQKETRNKIH